MAPSLPETPAGTPDPVRELRERQSAAIASRLKDPHREAAAAGGVDGAATPPKPGKSSAPSSPPKSSAISAASPSSSATPPAPATKGSADSESPSTETPEGTSSETPTVAAEPTATARGPRYDVKSMKKWAEEHPEEAAEIRAHVFGMDPTTNEPYIRLQNKTRKLKDAVRAEREAFEAEKAAAHAEVQAKVDHAEKIANEIRYVAEMWGSAQRKNAQGEADPDFDAIIEAFRINTGGITLSDFNRMNARRGQASPEIARLKAENARLARLAAGQAPPAQLPAGQTNGAAGAGTPGNGGAAAAPAPAHPAAPEVDAEALWGGELPKVHPIRKLAGWADELHAEMQKYHDETLDEYSRDPEEVADVVMRRMLKAFEPDEEEAPAPARRAPAGKPNTPKNRKGRTAFSEEREAPATSVPGIPNADKLKPRGAVNTDRSHREVTLDEIQGFDGGIAARERLAMQRHRDRVAGKRVD